MLNRVAIVATKTAVAMPAHDSEHGGPVGAAERLERPRLPRLRRLGRSEQQPPPLRTSSIEEPVATIPTTNTTSPIAITAGITSGRFTTRTEMSRITPNARAESQWARWYWRISAGTQLHHRPSAW